MNSQVSSSSSLSSSPALIKKLVWCLAGEVETVKQNNNTVKFECFEAPKVLMREQARHFLCKHFFVNPVTDSKLISFLVAQSDIIIVRSNLFRELDYSYSFGYLHSVYKRFLQELIIDSSWNALIKCDGCLSVSGHLILIKDSNVSSSPSVAALLKILQPRNKDKVDPEEFAKKEIVTIPKGAKIEDVVNENYRKRWVVLTAPVAGSAVKVKREEDGSW